MLTKLEDYTLEELQKFLMRQVNIVLPTLAKQNSWVIQLNHCFGRVLLDNLFQGCWYNYLNKGCKIPAYKQLSKQQLIQTLNLALLIETKGNDYLIELNNHSLKWRGKLNTLHLLNI